MSVGKPWQSGYRPPLHRACRAPNSQEIYEDNWWKYKNTCVLNGRRCWCQDTSRWSGHWVHNYHIKVRLDETAAAMLSDSFDHILS